MAETKRRLARVDRCRKIITVIIISTLVYMIGIAEYIEINETADLRNTAIESIIAAVILLTSAYFSYRLQLYEDILITRLNRYNKCLEN